MNKTVMKIRLAAAIDRAGRNYVFETHDPNEKDLMVALATAVLECLRSPTNEMVNAVDNTSGSLFVNPEHSIEWLWETMVDSALGKIKETKS